MMKGPFRDPFKSEKADEERKKKRRRRRRRIFD